MWQQTSEIALPVAEGASPKKNSKQSVINYNWVCVFIDPLHMTSHWESGGQIHV